MMSQRNVARKTAPRVTRGIWGTQWKVEKELQDSAGLAFVRRYLSLFDFQELEWITLGRSPRLFYYYYKPYHGMCKRLRRGTSSGLYRINCTVLASARYPAETGHGQRTSSGKLQPYLVDDENEAVVAVVAHEVSHYLGWTGQIPANGRVDSDDLQSTSEVEADEFMRAAVEAYRRSIDGATSSDDKLPGNLAPPARARWCVVCGKRLSKGGGSHDFCSGRCRSTYHNRLRGARTAVRRGEMVCEVCGAHFTPKRSDAKTCSPACRQKNYRRTHSP